MAPADHLHLRGRGLHAPLAAAQHGVGQLPAGVGHELQQGLVHDRQRHLGASGGLSVGQRGADGDLGGAAHLVAGLVGRDLDVDAVGLGAHADLGHAQAVGGLGQVDQGRGRDVLLALVPEGVPPLARRLEAPGEEAVPGHLAQSPAQGQHAHVDVGAPVGLDLQLHGGVLAIELHDLGADDAFAFHGDQGRRVAEGHAHLEARGLAGLVAALFGQHVHAVMVLAAEPQFALARDPDAGGGLGGPAILVGGGDDQLHLAGLRQLGLALHHALGIAVARAHRAHGLERGLVVVAVKAPHQALAAAGGDAGDGLHLDRHAGLGLAVHAQRQRLELELAARGDPAFGTHAGHDGRGPQHLRAAQGLHLTVGIGIGGLDQQLARLAQLGQVLDLELAQSFTVQRHGQLVGHHLAVLGGRGLLVIALARVLGAARCREAEALPVAAVHPGGAHQGGHAHRQVGGRAAGDVVHLHLHRQAGDADQGLLAFGAHTAFEHGQAEFLDTEAARAEAVVAPARAIAIAAQLHGIRTELGTLGHGETVFRTQAARARGTPLQRLRVLLAAAFMGDDQLRGPLLGQRKAALPLADAGLGTHQVLHGHGLAGAQQRAVENGVGHLVALGAAAGGHVEAPGLDAALPVAPGEGQLLLAVLALGACADEVGRRAVADTARALGRLGRQAFQARHATGVGGGRGQHLAIAVGDLDLGIGHGLALVQRGHPGGRVLAAELEVHGQVGHQGRGAHIHAARRAVALIEQRLAQQRRGDLDHVKARRERNAHHLEGARIALDGLGQLQRLDVALAGQQRQHARLHIVAVFVVDHGRQRALDVARGALAVHVGGLVVGHAAHPGNDLGIAAGLLGAHAAGIQGLGGQLGLHIAQRHGQQGRAVRAFGIALDDAEGRGRELGQRRQRARGHLQREHVGIAQAAACRVLELRRQLHRIARLGLHGGREAQVLHQRILAELFAVFAVDHGRHLGGAAAQANALGQLARHGGIEAQAHGADRQAGGLGVLALAAELGREGFAHAVLEALVLAAGHAVGRGNAGAKNQLHGRARRQPAVAGQRGVLQRVLGGGLVPAAVLEQLVALLAVDQAHGNALAHAFGRAPHVLLQALQGGRARQAQREVLLLVDLFIGVGRHVQHGRAAGLELVAGSARHGRARRRLVAGHQLGRAAHAGRQGLLEVEHPFPVAVPAARALGGRRIAAAERDRRGGLGVAKAHGRAIELHHHLLDLGHLSLRAELAHAHGLRRQRRRSQQQAQTPPAPGPAVRRSPLLAFVRSTPMAIPSVGLRWPAVFLE